MISADVVLARPSINTNHVYILNTGKKGGKMGKYVFIQGVPRMLCFSFPEIRKKVIFMENNVIIKDRINLYKLIKVN